MRRGASAPEVRGCGPGPGGARRRRAGPPNPEPGCVCRARPRGPCPSGRARQGVRRPLGVVEGSGGFLFGRAWRTSPVPPAPRNLGAEEGSGAPGAGRAGAEAGRRAGRGGGVRRPFASRAGRRRAPGSGSEWVSSHGVEYHVPCASPRGAPPAPRDQGEGPLGKRGALGALPPFGPQARRRRPSVEERAPEEPPRRRGGEVSFYRAPSSSAPAASRAGGMWASRPLPALPSPPRPDCRARARGRGGAGPGEGARGGRPRRSGTPGLPAPPSTLPAALGLGILRGTVRPLLKNHW